MYLYLYMHTFSFYCSEAINHKMAMICSIFKLTAIYLEQKGKIAELKRSEGAEENAAAT